MFSQKCLHLVKAKLGLLSVSQGLSSEKQKGLVQLYFIKMLKRDASVVSLNIGVIVLLRKEANYIYISLSFSLRQREE